jgi:thymidylate synthase
MTSNYSSAQEAFLGQLQRLLVGGRHVTRRTDPTLELVAESFVIDDPLNRCITTPHRNNNVAAAVAESLWMVAGRDDISFLNPYLPRSAQFSDDGLTWRGAYGPRLRRSFGVDQLAHLRDLLLKDPQTRRAVANLYDPSRDFEETLDVPCNNWLQFLEVDGALDLSITARSIDLMWGFSGIDAFQWSVLQELMANWVGLPVGRQHWFIGSCHLYERHHHRADKILAAALLPRAMPSFFAYRSSWETLGGDLGSWFETESLLRSGKILTCPQIESRIDDPMLQSFAIAVAGFWDVQFGLPMDARLAWLGETELGLALEHWASWWCRGR